MWSLTKFRDRDSVSCIQMMLNKALSTLLSPHLSFTPAQTFFFLHLAAPGTCSLNALPHPSSPYIFISFLSSIYRLLSPLFQLGLEYIASCLAPSPPDTLSLSPSISPSFFLIFVRDKCAKALSSLSFLKRRLSGRHREVESAF